MGQRQAQKVSVGNKDPFCSDRNVHYTLTENLSSFCPCPKTLEETEIVGGGCINLADRTL